MSVEGRETRLRTMSLSPRHFPLYNHFVFFSLPHSILHCSYSSMKSTMAYSTHLSHHLSFHKPQLVELELGREDSQSDGDLGPKSLEAKAAKSSP
jgi:hypothetical protein